ncbi:MAG: Asp-tRNA(Asn)/Glu-tRNA(Gln) amidotransferase subunit GatC, partial [Pseudomonadales bacterium]
DTSDVEPMANSLDAVQRLRVDQAIHPENPIEVRDTLQQIAPATEDGLYLVPKVID